MNTMNRRKFIQTGLTGLAGFSIIGCSGILKRNNNDSGALTVDKVKLGNSGLTVSRIAMGTGSVTRNRNSNQTRLGMEKFAELAHHAYECGINFYDTADAYGSHPFVGNAIKTLPREKLIILSKMWTQFDNYDRVEPFMTTFDRYRTEIGSDYIDILLMHCLLKGGWSESCKFHMDAFSKAKQDGLVKAIGVSCHNIDALEEAAVSPWVDVIMARINPFETMMDGPPDAVKAILATAKKNGKGIIGMKVFGEGQNVTDDERQQSLQYVLTEGNTHCMTLGMESEAQMDDAIERVMKIVGKG